MSATNDDSATGWDAITSTLDDLYPGQEPKHYGTLLSWQLGGPDPLDGISVWKRTEPVSHWHYVTYGLTDLSSNGSNGAERSGYGFELTFRLACKADDNDPPIWVIHVLQNLARYVFQTGNVLKKGDWMSANGPLALDQDTLICSLAVTHDPELPAISTPNGRVSFLQIVGLTQDEEDVAKRWATSKLLDAMLPHMPLWVTSLGRASLLSCHDVEAAVTEGMRGDGSASGYLFADNLSWKTEESPGPASQTSCTTEITLGALAMEGLISLMPGRLPFGRDLSLAGRDQSIQFETGSVNRVTASGDQLRIQLAAATVEDLLQTLRARAGNYVVTCLSDVHWTVEKSDIRDNEGNVVSTSG